MSDTTTTTATADAHVLAFIGRLRERYARVQTRRDDPDAFGAQRQTLLLAEAALRYVNGPDRPPQVAVIGPTQTGKSTIVNVLVGQSAAEVSPLAGFTVHPQGFWLAPPNADDAWLAALFPGWQRREASALTRDDLSSFAVTRVAPSAGDPNVVMWDTPDFDSLAARTYARGVLETAALADVVVLVLSKEKYADLSVWHLLALLAPLAVPMLICLNKCTPESQDVVLTALRQRVGEKLPEIEPPLVTLPHDSSLVTVPRDHGDVATLREAVHTRIEAAQERGRRVRRSGARALIQQHWDAWLAPVRAEHAALATWRTLVQDAAGGFMTAYDRDYLNHPERYDSFRRAAIELLNLLEIPRVGRMVAQTRQWITWPARQLWAAGRSWWETRQRRGDALHSLGMEATVLVDSARGLLAGLQREVARRCLPGTSALAVWQALQRRLETDEPRLRDVIETAIREHHARVAREIEQTAHELYRTLQKHPARLNALRGARATMDLGYILVAVKSGGLTPLDAVWASASFALTSLLMEGATGVEMMRMNGELKARQRAAVEQYFVQGVLVKVLSDLAGDLESAGLFNISDDEVSQAQAAVQRWENADE